MLRLFTAAAFLALTLASAQAEESLATRIHTAAVAACAPETSASLPLSHYGAISQSCVARISRAALVKYQALAESKAKAFTAAN